MQALQAVSYTHLDVYKRQEEEYLGGKNTPEVASPNALAIGDGWVYYLALAPSNEGLNAEEQGLNGSLFRMRPSDQTKELLSNQVTGFLEAEGQIYYASNGTVFKAESGTSYPVGENQYQVKIQDNIAYLPVSYTHLTFLPPALLILALKP